MASPPKAASVSGNSTDTGEEQQDDAQGEQSSHSTVTGEEQQDDAQGEQSSPPPPPPPSPSPPPPSPSTPPPAVPPLSPPPPQSSPPPPSPPPATPSSPSPPPPAISQPTPNAPSDKASPAISQPTPNAPSETASPEGKTPPPPSQTPSNRQTPPSMPDVNPSIPQPKPKSTPNTPELPAASRPAGKSPPEGDSGESSGDGAMVVGAAIGVVMFLIIISLSAIVCYLREKKKNRKPGSYSDGGGANGYYNRGGDHHGKAPQPLAVPAGGGWHGAPSPLSGEMTTASYSGPQGSPLPPPSPNIALGFNKTTFTYEELAAATGGFSQANMIGQGGFGYVFSGTLPNGKEVAIKQLKAGSGQGEREFQAEVDIISRVHHRHLVSLVGYCIAGAHRILIYEFVPNKTLEYHLHGKGVPVMDWPTRLRIAMGSAKGLAYLHEDCHPRIIHRDIKTANILIDYNFEAMVADFGLAKLSSDTNTHVSTRVMGTFGYLAPEYASTGKLTDKSDVFSYGVMLLELITGRRPVSSRMDDSLVDWARPMLGQVLADESYGEVVDPRLEGDYNPAEMARMIACAAACVRHSARVRPRMSQVVRALEGDAISFEDLSAAVKPGHSSQASSAMTSEVESSSSYTSEMKAFQRLALASGEHTMGYSGVATSEYGLNPSSDSSLASSCEMPFGAGGKPRGQA